MKVHCTSRTDLSTRPRAAQAQQQGKSRNNALSKDTAKQSSQGLSQGCGSGRIFALPLPHRLFDLKSNLAKKFCPFPHVD